MAISRASEGKKVCDWSWPKRRSHSLLGVCLRPVGITSRRRISARSYGRVNKEGKCALCVKRSSMTEIQMLCGRQWCVIDLERNQRCSTLAARKRPEQKDRSGATLREREELFCRRGKQSLAADPCECALRGTVPNLLAAPSTVEPQKKKKSACQIFLEPMK